jgi:hypothetical protein
MELEKLKEEEAKWESRLLRYCEKKALGLSKGWPRHMILDIEIDISHAYRRLGETQEQIKKYLGT